MLKIQQIKGQPENLTGKLLAYARVETPSIISKGETESGMGEMIRNGILAVRGDYEDHRSLKDFIKKEFNTSVEEGMKGMLEQLKEMGEIPENLDQSQIKEKLESFSRMEIIPVPARVVFFNSEAELLDQNCDIFFLGYFKTPSHAHLAVTSFPILYQARYREQETETIQSEIGGILKEIESGVAFPSEAPFNKTPAVLALSGKVSDYKGNLLNLLEKDIVPVLLYNLTYPAEFRASMDNFLKFMQGYRFPEDIAQIRTALESMQSGGRDQSQRVDLLCQKISALHHEQFEKLKEIENKLRAF
jgi:hypothetical protein